MLEKPVSIPARSHLVVLVEHGDNLPSRDYMFKPVSGCPVALFATLVDLLFYTMLARNNTN